MAATIITFPDIHERNDREFDRTGSTPYIRAIDEAHDLGGMAMEQFLDRPAYRKRLDSLCATITGFAAWREVDDILPIELCGGEEVHIRLRDVASFLRTVIGDEVACPAQGVSPRVAGNLSAFLEVIAGRTLGKFGKPPIDGEAKPINSAS